MFDDIAGAETLSEIIKLACRRLDPVVWDSLTGGSETETTLRRNRQALDQIAFRPRVLNDVRAIDLSTTFLGARQRIPVFLAPIGSLIMFDPGAALCQAEAAGDFGVSSIISPVSPPGMEAVRAGCQAHMAFQIYVRGDDDWLIENFDRAAELGYAAYCLTVDTAIYGRRERDIIQRYVPPGRRRASGWNFQASLSWRHVEMLRRRSDIPLMLKGIATAEDAHIAVEHGVDIVYISNHGGRQLDHGRGAIAVLPEIVDAVGDRASVIIDGGFMRASDILKALALGADMVGTGRLCCMGMAAGGRRGVVRVLELLETEMIGAMGLLGLSSLDQLTPEFLQAASPVRPATVTSAHPMIDIRDRTY